MRPVNRREFGIWSCAANPLYAICRTQQDVRIEADWEKLIPEVRDSHWVMAYGNALDAARYAARKIGIRWVDV